MTDSDYLHTSHLRAPALNPGAGWSSRHIATMTFVMSALAIAIGISVGYHSSATAEICLGIFAVSVCFLLPLNLLPIAAVLAAVVIPVQLYKVPVGTLPFAIWVLRSQRLHISTSIRLLGTGLGCWLILSELAAPFHTNLGFLWFVTMMVTVVMPIVLQRGMPGGSLRSFYVNLAGALALYAIVEAVVLHNNPIFGELYAHSTTDPVRQVWSTYRSTTLIGHPLVNAVIFGSALILSIDTYLSSFQRSAFAAARCVALLGGLAATVSRGPTIAAAVGVVVLLIARRGDTVSISKRTLITAAIVCAALIAVPLLLARGESNQGRESLQQRSHLVQDTEAALGNRYLLGVGPGQAEAFRSREGLLQVKLPLESMFAQVLVELGIPGVTLLFALILTIIGRGLFDQRSVGPASALLTTLIALCTFDSIELRQSLMIVLGMLILLTLAGSHENDPFYDNTGYSSSGQSH
jgi:hypothetical protein